jgi:uncharacterized protein (DUF58 family)
VELTQPIPRSTRGRLLAALRRVFLPDYLTNRRVRFRPLGVIVLILIAAIGGGALNTGNNLLYLVLSVLLAALLFSFAVSEAMIGDAVIRRELPPTVTEHSVFAVTYTFTNPNRFIPALALVFEEEIEMSRVRAFAGYVPPRSSLTVRAKARGPSRGKTSFTNQALSTSAPFGWFHKKRRVRLPGEIVSLPRTDAASVDEDRLAAHGETRPQSRKGQGDELFGFRGYLPGDPLRDIHWKTSARAGALLVREKEAEVENRLRLVLDLAVPRPAAPDPAREAAVHQAASIASTALERGFAVRLEAPPGHGIDFGAGPGHLHLILLHLALFDHPGSPPAPSPPFTDAAPLLLP